ncbi:MAG: MCE family protein [Planctomycetes bacterium]|nr:MCE family protein [Planctomycetota bacterium]
MNPSFKFRHLNRIVGAFVLAGVAVLLAGIVVVGKARHWMERSFSVDVAFRAQDIGLLHTGLPVKILGDSAGQVMDAHLQSSTETRATLSIRESFRKALRADCYAIVHTPVAGLLGETFVEVWPGQSTVPLQNDALIPGKPGEDLVELAKNSVASFGQAAGEIRDLIAENRKEIAQAIINVRRMSDNLDHLVSDNQALVNQVLTRLDEMGRQVSELVAENRANVKESTARLPAAIDHLGAGGKAIADAGVQARDLIAENRADLRLIAGRLASAAPKVDRIATDLQAVTDQIASGKGTVGKLVMEDTAHDKVVKATDSLTERLEELKPITGGMSELKLYGGLEGGQDFRSGSWTAGVYLRLEPRAWKFYQGGVSYRSAPRDRDSPKESPDSIPVDFNLLLGWRFLRYRNGTYALTVAGGLIETRLGGYVEMPLFGDRLAIRALIRGKHSNRELDDRRYEDGTVLVRATASLRIWKGLYVVSGVNDCVDAPGAWVGARAELLDNDLRNITSVSGLFK